MNSLHHCKDNAQTARFCCESINLIGSPPHVAKKAFNRIRATNIPMHDLRESIKRQEMRFIFAQTPHGFGIALSVLAFECCSFGQRLFFGWLFPNARQFRCY
jgi:hypothetical protein